MDNETHAREVARLARLEASDPHGHLGGSVVADLRVWLHSVANGKCALCGTATRLDAAPSDADRAEVSHVISVGDSKRGMGKGAVFNGCRGCNIATGDRSLVPYLHLFADVFAIPTEWPTRGEMKANNPRNNKSDMSGARRAALGFDF